MNKKKYIEFDYEIDKFNIVYTEAVVVSGAETPEIDPGAGGDDFDF